MGSWVIWRHAVLYNVSMLSEPRWTAVTSLEGTRDEAVQAARDRAQRDVREGDLVNETENGCMVWSGSPRPQSSITVEAWPAGHRPRD